MLLLIQFPLADARFFLDPSRTGQLPFPDWKTSPTTSEFIRFFGGIKYRKKGGAPFFGGEDKICEANHALRFCHNPVFEYDRQDSGQVPVKHRIRFRTYRRLYFDGTVMGKFEISLGSLNTQDIDLSKALTKNLIDEFLGLPVQIRNPQDFSDFIDSKLYRCGSLFAQLYAAVSTDDEFRTSHPVDKWWVQAGEPVLFFVGRSHENIRFPFWMTPVPVPKKYGFRLLGGIVSYRGTERPIWAIQYNKKRPHKQARLLRLYLLRLHAAHECLRILLRHLQHERITFTPRTDLSDTVQKYLHNATKQIAKWETTAAQRFSPELIEIARESINAMRPGDTQLLKEAFERLDIRPNLRHNLQQYTQNDARHTTIINNPRYIHVQHDYFEQVDGNVTTGQQPGGGPDYDRIDVAGITRKQLEECYMRMSDKLHTLRKARLIENDPATKFKLKYQIEEAEEELKIIEQRLEEVEDA